MSALPASVSSSSSWIPEDDLLLKNSIESGASLEALAKGAVRFSRKFTVRELQDRWRSLLYDPVISDQAAARMIEVELSASNLSSKSNKFDNPIENGSAKRKFESVRRSYYAMRKRTCNRHVTNSSGVSFLGSPNGHDCIQSIGYDELVGPRKDCVQNQFGFPDLVIGSVDKRPQEDDLQVISKKDCFGEKAENLEQNDVPRGSPCVIFEASDKFSHPSGVEGIKPYSVGCSSPQPDMPLWKTMEDVPAAVMPVNDGPGDKVQHVEGEIVHAEDVDDDASKTKEPETLVSDVCPGTSEAAYPTKLDEVPDQHSHSGHPEQSHFGNPEINLPSSASLSNPHFPEFLDEVVCCMLNSEDPEIPCNDDVLLGKGLTMEKCHQVGSEQASSLANQKDSKEELSLIQTEDDLIQCFTAPKMVGLDILSESSQGVKSEIHDGQCLVISRQSQNSLVNPYRFKAAHTFPNSAADGAAKEEPSDECNTKNISTYAEENSIVDTVLECEANNASDHIEYESDGDVPSFSDIEAMILEMDLCPEEFDSFIKREVSRYQDEHSQRTIIRLEQGARSAMQRAIASRGAFAVLYGLHMKHYIKESEVILGRATMDVDVDIDLGREGRANKISRRQAIIKMEEDGSFSLKNLGKSSVFLNGKEVSTGQLMALGSSSLIEIRDMAFVFEIDQNSVERHLANITPNNQEKKTAFDWSEEPKKTQFKARENGKQNMELLWWTFVVMLEMN
ncbi:hypothetical protein V6N13_072225 [Hibiscus sabdariffa]|uniref:FHA domain-containing protein n=1 Tax=Hibiscus sabdariffa TaxID=183260 RepID=A0ABR2R8R5_9ROSI